MNERIKEISVKAGFPEWSNHAIEFELSEFAELLVFACGEFCNQSERNAMFKYFGVEE